MNAAKSEEDHVRTTPKSFITSKPVLAVIASFLLLAAVFHEELQKLWWKTPLGDTVDIPFAQLEVVPNEFEVEGFQKDGDAYYLPPGARGRCLFRMRINPPSPLAIEPVFYNITDQAERFLNSFSYSLDDGRVNSWVVAWTNRSHLRSQAVIIPPSAGGSVVLRFDAHNTTDSRAMTLQGIRYRVIHRTGIVPRLSYPLFCIGGLLVVFQIVVSLRSRAFQWRRIDGGILLVILAMGLHQRESKLEEYAWSPLTGDAVGYHQIAEEFHLFSWKDGFYAPRWREPVFPLVNAMFFAVFGNTDFHQRLVTMFIGVLAIALTWWVGRGWIHPLCGLTAAAIMAQQDYLIFRSMYGYRLEVRTFIMLLFVYFLFVWRRTQPNSVIWKQPVPVVRSLLSGLFGALLILTEMSTLPLVGLCLAYYLYSNRETWQRSICAPLTCALILLPFVARQMAAHGDPLFPLSKHAKWYRNKEARRYAGQPGYPSATEAAGYQAYGGPPTGLFSYLFNSHSLSDLSLDTAKGYGRFLSGKPFFRQWALRVAFGAGLLLLLLIPGRREIGFIILMTNSPPAMFLYGAGLLEDERILLHVMPYAAISVAVPLLSAWELLRRSSPSDDHDSLNNPGTTP